MLHSSLGGMLAQAPCTQQDMLAIGYQQSFAIKHSSVYESISVQRAAAEKIGEHPIKVCQ